MLYTVKNILEKKEADVLLEHYLGPLGNLFDAFSDPRILSMEFYRNQDKSYAEINIIWQSEKSYLEWDNDHKIEHQQGRDRMDQYHKDMNIRFETFFPPYEYFQSYNGKLDKISFEKIFVD